MSENIKYSYPIIGLNIGSDETDVIRRYINDEPYEEGISCDWLADWIKEKCKDQCVVEFKQDGDEWIPIVTFDNKRLAHEFLFGFVYNLTSPLSPREEVQIVDEIVDRVDKKISKFLTSEIQNIKNEVRAGHIKVFTDG